MKKIIVSGFGGQGVLLLGKLISYSALAQNLNTSWLPSYGPEMRGGTANASVQYAKEEIAAPVIDTIDVLIAFNEPSVNKFAGRVVPGGKIIVNSNIVKMDSPRADVKYYKIPADELAAEKGNKRGGNTIMLGALVQLAGDLTEANAVEGLKAGFEDKPAVIAPNIECLKYGIEFAKKLK